MISFHLISDLTDLKLSPGQITFKVEDLSKPESLLPLKSVNDIYKNLILEEKNISKNDVSPDFDCGIIAFGDTSNKLVNYGTQSFFEGMYHAYAEHRPFVLSPDMIWLLISQGFAQHVNANSEELRHLFVDFKGVRELVVETNNDLFCKDADWMKIFEGFSKQISDNVGEELVKTLTADFSTTTVTERVASQITIMDAMKQYFEYVSVHYSCGIPEITLLGTPSDWQKIYEKTCELEKYELRWWTKKIKPILKEFIRASKGMIDKNFWMKMFRYHTLKQYGSPEVVDGWIVKFFPYDKNGNRNNLKTLPVRKNKLPDEIAKVNMKYIIADNSGNIQSETMLELWAGFVGLEQDPETFALKPVIDWMVKTKYNNIIDEPAVHEFEKQDGECGIELDIAEVPKLLGRLDMIQDISLYFGNDVFIPEWMKNIEIYSLSIRGKISDEERNKIISYFPNTHLYINGEKLNDGKYNLAVVEYEGVEFDSDDDDIWALIFSDPNYGDDVYEKIRGKRIKFIVIKNAKNADVNIKKLKSMFPDAKIKIGY